MPIYLFQNQETEEITEVFFGMNDDKKHIDENGLEWKRIFTVPNASIDTKIDPNSAKEFVQKTGNKKGTVGDMLDLSAELSAKREAKDGKDSVKEKFFEDYKKKTNGKKHMSDTPKKIETKTATITF